MAAEKSQIQGQLESMEANTKDLMKLKDKLLHDNSEQDRELSIHRAREEDNRRLIEQVKEDLSYC